MAGLLVVLAHPDDETGASEPQHHLQLAWGRTLKVVLLAFCTYAQAVHMATSEYID